MKEYIHKGLAKLLFSLHGTHIIGRLKLKKNSSAVLLLVVVSMASLLNTSFSSNLVCWSKIFEFTLVKDFYLTLDHCGTFLCNQKF